MAIICAEYDLMFTHVPKTGGTFVQRVLRGKLGGNAVGPKHASVRWTGLRELPSIRAFVVREPVSWYRSYWAYARQAMRDRNAWPVWEGGRRSHPTKRLDERCGAPDFEGLVRNSLREFPDGFLRSTYCDFLNGSTHAIRNERMRDDLAALLEMVGFAEPGIVHKMPDVHVTGDKWKSRAVLPPELEEELVATENLDGLDIPYLS